jgi:hypothetical protein
VTGGELVRGRLERRDESLAVLGAATCGQPYVFEGVTNIFVPVRLESRSVSRRGRPLHYRWQYADRELGTNATLRVTLPAAATPALVTLTVAEEGGATNRDVITLSTDMQPRYIYRVAGRLVGIPAVGYGADLVQPEIHVRATSPDDVDFKVAAAIETAAGGILNIVGRVDMERSWGRLVLPPTAADSLRRIAWRVMLDGVTLDAGATRFDAAPFHGLPDALDGEALRERGETVMLVARQASAGTVAPVAPLQPGQRLALLDGFLAVGAAADSNAVARLEARLGRAEESDSASAVVLQYVDLNAPACGPSFNGVVTLLPFTQTSAWLPADVVVVAPSFGALEQGETLAAFERRLSAFVGLLAGPGHAAVVLVTPPPFATLPGCVAPPTGLTPPAARQMAELICRVADANGLPVVDLFTAFMTADNRHALLKGDALTPEGLELAADILRRALYGTPRKAGAP